MSLNPCLAGFGENLRFDFGIFTLIPFSSRIPFELKVLDRFKTKKKNDETKNGCGADQNITHYF